MENSFKNITVHINLTVNKLFYAFVLKIVNSVFKWDELGRNEFS